MNIDALKPGDVLLYSALPHSWLSQAIAFLTNSDVSHAAMSYFDTNKIVEEAPPQAKIRDAKESFKGRAAVYVMRHKGDAELEPVLKSAQRYVEMGTPYPKSNMYLLGLILIYKKFTVNSPAKKLMVKVLKFATRHVIEYINRRQHPDKLPMVCSQFVFQCYDDAGPSYRLAISQGVLQKAEPQSAGEQSYLDRAIVRASQQTPTTRPQVLASNLDQDMDETEEEVARQLLELFQNDSALLTAAEEPDDDKELLDAIEGFAQALSGDAVTGLELLAANKAIFVTPADLLAHCNDLTPVGVIKA